MWTPGCTENKGAETKDPLRFVTAASLRCAKSPYGRTGVLGCLFSAQNESARFSSAPEAVVAPSSSGRIHHPAAADPLHQMTGRAQQRLPSLYGVPPFPLRGPRSLQRFHPGAGRSLVPCWTPAESHVQDFAPQPPPSCSARTGVGAPTATPDPQGGEAVPPRPESGGAPGRPPSAAPGLTGVRLRPAVACVPSPSPPATPHNSSLQLQGRAPECAEAAPSPSRRGVWGAKFRLHRFPLDQAIPVCVDCPAGSQGELFVRISWQALSEPFGYAPDILAGSATPLVKNIHRY
ncbi:hypothetical protein NDU88_004032 [Pleurodeles waltl]|uniref:Uncharacterized protein n=1 Tax=Pleurodeles waltl TaxID=8319 RepID=A0AAV7PB94_PLEWA|nr:hypothetical protein NDU88_004032 [Pleurodeles waltl]